MSFNLGFPACLKNLWAEPFFETDLRSLKMGPFTGCVTRDGFLRRTNEKTAPYGFAWLGSPAILISTFGRHQPPNEHATTGANDGHGEGEDT